jgi:hypothetical protein
MKGLLLVGAFLFSAPLYAQSASVLFPTSGKVAGVAIPFEVTAGGEVAVVSVRTQSDTANCKTLVDLYRPSIFHLKCRQEGDVVLMVSYRENGYAKSLLLPSFHVSAISGAVIGPDPGDDPDIPLGQNLYNAYCISCHSPATQKKGRNAGQIASAIQNINEMKDPQRGLKDLSSSDLAKIAKYLGSL